MPDRQASHLSLDIGHLPFVIVDGTERPICERELAWLQIANENCQMENGK